MNAIHSLGTGAPPYETHRVPRRVPRFLILLLLALLVACALALVSSPTTVLAQGFVPGPAPDDPPLNDLYSPDATLVETAGGIGLFVVGGSAADQGEYPWQVLLRVDGRFVCGGSLVHPRWVLTAAHCVTKVTDAAGTLFYYPAHRLEVIAGEHTRYAPDFVEQTRDVVQVLVHPSYRSNTPGLTPNDYDVALIKLRTPVEVNESVQTIRLAAGEAAEQVAAAGRAATLTGWGVTISGDMSSAANILQEVEVPIADQAQCASAMAGLAPVTARMLCAGAPQGGSGGCFGDSGGPLVVHDGQTGWWQVGVVSWGSSLCAEDPYGFTVLTRVSSVADWVYSIVNVADGTPTLVNGDFAAGSAGWVTSSTKGLTLIGGAGPGHSTNSVELMGSLGGAGNETSRIRQFVYLSDRTLALHFDYSATSEEDACGADKAVVRHGSATLATMQLCRGNIVGGWQHQVLDIPLQAGNNGWLEFVVTTDRERPSSLLIDNIRLEVTPLEPLAVAAVGPLQAVAGAPIAVEGLDLANVVEVTFGATPARFTVESAHALTAWVPKGAANAPITLRTAYSEAHSPEIFSTRTLLLVQKTGTGSGTVVSLEPGLWCGYDCAEEYAYGTQARLVAMAAPGSFFAGWSGACTGLGECLVSLQGDRVATATFEPQQSPVLLVRGSAEVGRALTFDAALPMSMVDSCMWTFGDGSSAPCLPAAAASDGSGSVQTISGLSPAAWYSRIDHVFPRQGAYVVTLVATNAAGAFAAAVTIEVTGTDLPRPSEAAPEPVAAVARFYLPMVIR